MGCQSSDTTHNQNSSSIESLIAYQRYDQAAKIANECFKGGQKSNAIRIYQAIIKANPKQDYDISGCGNIQQSLGYYQWNVYGWYQQQINNQAIKINPYDALSLCYCQAHTKQQLIYGGIEWYGYMIEKYPQNWQLMIGLGNILFNNGQYQQSEEIYQKVLKLKPQLVRVHTNIGLLYEFKKIDKEKAIVCARTALELDANNIIAKFILARNQKTVDLKIQKLQLLIGEYPQYLRIINEIGLAYGGSKKDYDSAINWYKKCIEMSGHYVLAYNNIAVNYELKKQSEQAKKYYFNALEIDIEFKPSYKNLTDLFDQQKYSETRVINEIQNYPLLNLELFYYGLGLSYYTKNQYSKSALWLKNALKINQHNHLCHLALGLALTDVSKHEQAVEQYKKCIQLLPTFYKAYYNIGNIHKRLKRYDQSIQWYIKTIEIHSRHWEAYYDLAIIYKDVNKNNALAIQYFRKVIEIKPNSVFACIHLGLCLRNIESNHQAIEAFRKALLALGKDKSQQVNFNRSFLSSILQRVDNQSSKPVQQMSMKAVDFILKEFEAKFKPINSKQSKLSLLELSLKFP